MLLVPNIWRAPSPETACPQPEEATATAGGRAGRYVAQPRGYRAFMPALLPPQPPVHLEGELQALLSQADQSLGRLDGSIQTLPDPDLLVFMYVRKEAVLSSQIEGTQSSLQDVLAAEASIRSPNQSAGRRRSHQLRERHE